MVGLDFELVKFQCSFLETLINV